MNMIPRIPYPDPVQHAHTFSRPAERVPKPPPRTVRKYVRGESWEEIWDYEDRYCEDWLVPGRVIRTSECGGPPVPTAAELATRKRHVEEVLGAPNRPGYRLRGRPPGSLLTDRDLEEQHALYQAKVARTAADSLFSGAPTSASGAVVEARGEFVSGPFGRTGQRILAKRSYPDSPFEGE